MTRENRTEVTNSRKGFKYANFGIFPLQFISIKHKRQNRKNLFFLFISAKTATFAVH